MGNVVPDRFFWALPPPEEGDGGPGPDVGEPDEQAEPPKTPGAARRVH